MQDNCAIIERIIGVSGFGKMFFSPIGSKDFGGKHDSDIPWLDQPGALERLEQHPWFQALDAGMQSKIRQFVTDGYTVLENYFPEGATTALNAEVSRLLDSGKTGFNYTGRKIFNLPEQSDLAGDFPPSTIAGNPVFSVGQTGAAISIHEFYRG